MTDTVELLVQKGNTAFLAGNREDAILCYFNALEKAGALQTVLRYIQKNKENLSEDQLVLQELLYKKYHIRFVHGALPNLLYILKDQIEKIEATNAYQRFKKIILSKHPRTPEQYVDAFLMNFENQPSQEMNFLLKLLQEKGFAYSLYHIIRLCNDRNGLLKLQRFEQSLQQKSTTLFDIDVMDGHEFEEFLFDLFTRLGYQVERKKKSGEQGLDLLLERHGERIACQVKRRKKPVGNKAIQEVIAARENYRCQRALVVTNSTFTLPAKQLAARCNIELWNREVIKEKIKI